jgi:hypothetical protein
LTGKKAMEKSLPVDNAIEIPQQEPVMAKKKANPKQKVPKKEPRATGRSSAILALDDPRWHQLRTGYSPARKFLPALARLQQNPAEAPQIVGEFLDDNHVCHQYTVYETTVAVVPHFIHAARWLPAANRRELLEAAGFYALLLGVPLVADKYINVPPDIAAAYDQAVQDGRTLTGETLACAWNEKELSRLLTAVVGFQGHRRLGTMLYRVTGWGFTGWEVECPFCHQEFEPLVEWGKGF